MRPKHSVDPRTSTRMKTLCNYKMAFVINPDPSGEIHRSSYLLISNRKFSLRLLVILRKILQLLDRRCLRNRNAELYILFRVLVSWLLHISI
jgi:hypothetical protein